MKSVRTMTAPAAAALAATAWLAAPPTAQAAFEARNVLFIGNSYTYNAVGYDGVGQKTPPYGTTSSTDGTTSDRFFIDSYTSPFESMVAAAGSKYSVLDPLGLSQNIAVGGRTLSKHTNADGSSDRPTILWRDDYSILDPTRNGGITWDAIVLQEFSTTPGRTISGQTPYSQDEFDNFYLQGLSPIADKINQYSSGSEVILFNTWGRAPDAFTSGTVDGFSSYTQMRDLTDEAYAAASDYLTTTGTSTVFNPGTSSFLTGKGLDSALVDIALVGQAFDFVINDPNRPAGLGDVFELLYEDDFSHQAPAGEFLTAAVLFETLYGTSVTSLLDTMQLTGLSGGNDDFNTNYAIPFATAQYLAAVSQQITGVPEPGTCALLLVGGVLLAKRRRH